MSNYKNPDNYFSSLITIDSAHRSSGTNEQFTVLCTNEIHDCFAFRILDCFIPETYYLWTSTTLIQFTTNVTGLINISIPPGSYSASAIAAIIESEFLDQTTDSVTCTFDTNTFFFTLSLTPGVNATVSVTAGNITAAATGLEYLGFTIPVAAAADITGNQAFNFNRPRRIYVHSDALTPNYNLQTNSNDNSLQKTSCIKSVPCWITTGGYNLSDKPSDFYTFGTPQKIGKIDLVLRDEAGDVIDLHGYPWTINFELRYSRNY